MPQYACRLCHSEHSEESLSDETQMLIKPSLNKENSNLKTMSVQVQL
jgi:hypothetical protein